MSFGVSVGDIIAITNLTERIIGEVSSYRAAPQHFQRLSIELQFISKLCSQVLGLEPTLQSEVIQLQRIRAVVIQCLGPIREFEKKMRQYEEILGADAWKNGKGGVKERAKGLKRRLHWTMIERKEVDELRAILASEILVVNTMLSIHGWESFKTVSADTKRHTELLTEFISTTASATRDIMHALLQAVTQSTRIEELLRSSQLSSAEQLKILKHIDTASTRSEELTLKIFNTTKSQATTMNQIAQHVKGNITQTISVRRRLERLVKTIVQHSKNVILMVEKNTRILLQLQRTLKNLEMRIMQGGLSLPILVFHDPFGETMALPWQVCDTWMGFQELALTVLFHGLSKRNIRLHPFIAIRWIRDRNGTRSIVGREAPDLSKTSKKTSSTLPHDSTPAGDQTQSQQVSNPHYIAQGDQVHAEVVAFYPFKIGRRCYTCLSPISDADLRLSKCSACDLFLFQILPIEELISDPYADNRYNLAFGMASSAVGYAIYPDDLLEEMCRLHIKVMNKYYEASKERKRAHQAPLGRPLIVVVIIFCSLISHCFCYFS